MAPSNVGVLSFRVMFHDYPLAWEERYSWEPDYFESNLVTRQRITRGWNHQVTVQRARKSSWQRCKYHTTFKKQLIHLCLVALKKEPLLGYTWKRCLRGGFSKSYLEMTKLEMSLLSRKHRMKVYLLPFSGRHWWHSTCQFFWVP